MTATSTPRKPRTRKPTTPETGPVAPESGVADTELESQDTGETEAETSQDPDAKVWAAIGDPETPEPGRTEEQIEAAERAAEPTPGPKPAEAAKPTLFTVTVPAGLVTAFTTEVDGNWPGITLTAKGAKKTGKGPKPLPFPDGVIAPIAFHKLITSEGIAPVTLRAMTVYEWINRTAKNGFPVTYYAGDGTTCETKTDGTRPGVHVEQGRAWVTAKFADTPA